MPNNKIVRVMAVLFLSAIFASGCYDGTTVDLRSDLEITRDISFADDLIPILDNNCNQSGCHNAGGVVPDLSAATAFTSLVNGGYIDVANPENSSLYGYVNGTLAPVMPISGADPTIAATVLAWIKQGALNN